MEQLREGDIDGHRWEEIERLLRVRENEGRVVERVVSFVSEKDGSEYVALRLSNAAAAASSEFEVPSSGTRGWKRGNTNG